MVQHGDLSALSGEGAGDGGADGPAAAGHRDHLARQGLGLGLAELGLLQRPVFHLEGVGRADALEAAHGLPASDTTAMVVLGDVGGDGRVLAASAPRRTGPGTGNQHHARHGVEHGLFRFGLGVVTLEIGAVALGIGGTASARGLRGEVVQRRRVCRRQDHRPGLDADHMVGRGHAGLGVAGHILAAHEVEHCLAATML